MSLYDALARCQPDAGAGDIALRANAERSRRHAQLFARDANAVITHRKDPFGESVVDAHFHPDMNARRFIHTKLDGVAQQILEELSNQRHVAVHRRQCILRNDCLMVFDHKLHVGNGCP